MMLLLLLLHKIRRLLSNLLFCYGCSIIIIRALQGNVNFFMGCFSASDSSDDRAPDFQSGTVETKNEKN